MTKLAFVDTETTGLDRRIHNVWEIAIILRDTKTGKESEHEFQLDNFGLEYADPTALRINGFYTRYKVGDWEEFSNNTCAKQVAELLADAYFIAAVPDFDSYFIGKFLMSEGYAPAWHYHLVCVENLAAGFMGVEPPWRSAELYQALGLTREPGTEHTAMGDAKLVRDVYDAVMKGNTEKIQGNYCQYCGVGPGYEHDFRLLHPKAYNV